MRACLGCGSARVRMLTLGDGLWAEGGETLRWVCRDCHWQGQPLEFDDEASRRAFEAARRDEPDPSPDGND